MQIKSAKELGHFAKKIRTAQNLTQPELAGASGVGVRFIVDLEKGKPTCELEKVLVVLQMLGIQINLSSPLPENETAS